MTRNRFYGATLLAVGIVLGGCQQEVIVTGEPGIDSLRRLNESEYRNSIADIFGNDVEVIGRFEPDVREHGLNAIGSSRLTITPSGFEQYYAIGDSIAAQVLDKKRAATTLGCGPAAGELFDEPCARGVIARYGRLLFRRALSDDEIATFTDMAAAGASTFEDFNRGMRLAFASLMASPDFLFKVERSEPLPNKPDALRLDGYSKATRLSYLLWNTTPDEELLRAAENGSLHTEEGLRAQVDRLLQSPRLQAGVRALFTDMMQFDRFANVSKDPDLYPKFSQLVARSAQEETLRTVVDHLLTDDGDYRELFTTRETFINRSLAAVYKTRYAFGDEWMSYTFPEDEQRAGILSQVAFLTLHSHPGESSPTLRGVAINEIFRCEETPAPPANVDFSIVQDTDNPTLNTRRLRLEAHSTNPSCSGCHQKTDSLGLPLDHFDALGQIRRTEDGRLIDVSIDLEGFEYEGAPGLGAGLARDPQVPMCFVNHVYGYATGRWADNGNRDVVSDMREAFAGDGFRLRELFSDLVTHPGFFSPIAPQRGTEGEAMQTASHSD